MVLPKVIYVNVTWFGLFLFLKEQHNSKNNHDIMCGDIPVLCERQISVLDWKTWSFLAAYILLRILIKNVSHRLYCKIRENFIIVAHPARQAYACTIS